MPITCPICDRGMLHKTTVQESILYQGDELRIDDVELSRCDTCGEETVLPEQARKNERRFVDAKRLHDDLLTSDEIVGWRRSLKITQADAARILGGGTNALSKYERGEVMQSRAMDNLLRVSERFPEVRRFLFERAGITCPDRGWITLVENESTTPTKEIAATVVTREVFGREEWSPNELCQMNG